MKKTNLVLFLIACAITSFSQKKGIITSNYYDEHHRHLKSAVIDYQDGTQTSKTYYETGQLETDSQDDYYAQYDPYGTLLILNHFSSKLNDNYNYMTIPGSTKSYLQSYALHVNGALSKAKIMHNPEKCFILFENGILQTFDEKGNMTYSLGVKKPSSGISEVSYQEVFSDGSVSSAAKIQDNEFININYEIIKDGKMTARYVTHKDRLTKRTVMVKYDEDNVKAEESIIAPSTAEPTVSFDASLLVETSYVNNEDMNQGLGIKTPSYPELLRNFLFLGKTLESKTFHINGKIKEIKVNDVVTAEFYENGVKKSSLNNETNDLTTFYETGEKESCRNIATGKLTTFYKSGEKKSETNDHTVVCTNWNITGAITFHTNEYGEKFYFDDKGELKNAYYEKHNISEDLLVLPRIWERMIYLSKPFPYEKPYSENYIELCNKASSKNAAESFSQLIGLFYNIDSKFPLKNSLAAANWECSSYIHTADEKKRLNLGKDILAKLVKIEKKAMQIYPSLQFIDDSDIKLGSLYEDDKRNKLLYKNFKSESKASLKLSKKEADIDLKVSMIKQVEDTYVKMIEFKTFENSILTTVLNSQGITASLYTNDKLNKELYKKTEKEYEASLDSCMKSESISVKTAILKNNKKMYDELIDLKTYETPVIESKNKIVLLYTNDKPNKTLAKKSAILYKSVEKAYMAAVNTEEKKSILLKINKLNNRMSELKTANNSDLNTRLEGAKTEVEINTVLGI